MTNSEKAREYAADKFKVNPESKKWNITTTYMSACEWKDQQFKEYLEKLKDKCNKEYRKLASISNDEYVQGEQEAHGRLCMVEDIINELFEEGNK